MRVPIDRVLGCELTPRRPPGCPELELWLVAGHVDLDAHCEALMADGRAPYFAFSWGAGQALARYLLDHPAAVADLRVVDFGAGSGIAAIAAARAGAAAVVAVDADPDARAMIAHNAAHNGVALQIADTVPDDFDLLLAADVGYEGAAAAYVAHLGAQGHTLLLCEPERRGAVHPTAEAVARIEATTFPDVDYPTRFNVIYRIPGR
ncbi:MAG: 50S ribosomal protein L11 methyltransferase [Myxococcales bacterium]|nr:50S ribosomal protein L11 methyltransferase [Myxococcales bacterium]